MESEIKKFKLEKKHFEYFETCVKYYQRKLNLGDWRLYFRLGLLEDSYSKAEVFVDVDGMCATIYLAEEWHELKPTSVELRRTAFHEVCELLIWPLEAFASERFGVTAAELERERHSIIRRLETLVFEKERK